MFVTGYLFVGYSILGNVASLSDKMNKSSGFMLCKIHCNLLSYQQGDMQKLVSVLAMSHPVLTSLD